LTKKEAGEQLEAEDEIGIRSQAENTEDRDEACEKGCGQNDEDQRWKRPPAFLNCFAPSPV
jgi:hypothetical protein